MLSWRTFFTQILLMFSDMSEHRGSSSFAACFFATTTDASKNQSAPPSSLPPPSVSGEPNLTTCLYNTHRGLSSLTWSRTFLGHSIHLDIHSLGYASSPLSLCSNNSFSQPALSFHIHIKPFIFWKKHGSKKLSFSTNTVSKIQVFWDLSRAKFGSGPEPQSGFYIAVVVDGEISLLVGDCVKEAYAKTKAHKPKRSQTLLLRRDHVFGNKVYTTKAKFGGKTREISIECSVSKEARLYFSVDNVRILQIKRLKWKFRGNERIEIDGVPVQISWDLYNWLFDDLNSGHAVFMFMFENPENEEEEEEQDREEVFNGGEHFNDKDGGLVLWQQNSCNFGMNGIEWRKMRKTLMRTTRISSSSSISMSSYSSGCSSSVMEWASMEVSELSPGPNGFSLLVYVWKNDEEGCSLALCR